MLIDDLNYGVNLFFLTIFLNISKIYKIFKVYINIYLGKVVFKGINYYVEYCVFVFRVFFFLSFIVCLFYCENI